MCFSQKAPVQQAPPTPPPPAPVLEQPAPESAVKPQAQQQDANASGTKKYRTSLSIATPTSTGGMTANNSGLGISM